MYGYNNELADVIRPLGQGTVQKVEYGFRKIPDVAIRDNSATIGLNSNRISTGAIRGNQQIRGQIQVVDNNGRKVMVMGYGKGQF